MLHFHRLIPPFLLVCLFISVIPATAAQDSNTPSKTTASTSQSGKEQDDTKELSFRERMLLALVPVAVTGVLGILATIITGIFTYKVATRDKSPKFRHLNTGIVSIHDTDWEATYADNDPQKPRKAGSVHFEQFGNRLVGKGSVPSEHRTWMIEGVISNRRVCYMYHDDDPKRVSFGTAMLEFDRKGDTLTGVWNGWSPSGDQFSDLAITLTRRKK